MLGLGISTEVLLLISRVVFSAALGLSISVGILLAYHWLRFAMNPIVPVIATILYGAVCTSLLLVMLGAMAAW